MINVGGKSNRYVIEQLAGSATGMVNAVTGYKADNTGLTDSTSKLQSAATAAAGKILFIPDGEYLITSTLSIPANTTVFGYGAIIKNKTTHFTMMSLASGCRVFGLEIEGVTGSVYNANGKLISCVGTVNGVGVAPTYIEDILIRDCIFEAAGSSAVYAQFVDHLEVVNCRMSDLGYAGVEGVSCKNSKVNHNVIHDITGNGLSNAYGVYWSQVNTSDTVRHPFSNNCEANHNHIYDVPTWEALDTHGGINIRFINNRIDNCLVGVALIDADDEGGTTIAGVRGAIVRDNIISGARGWAISTSTITNTLRHSDILIDGNKMNDCGTSGTDLSGGIAVKNSDNVVVSNNVTVGCRNNGIAVIGDSEGIVIHGNVSRDMYSNNFATTCAIGLYGDKIRAAIFGNSLLSTGEFTGTYNNVYGLRFDTVATDVYVEVGQNNFDGATTSKYSLTSTQATNLQPPITQRGQATIAVTTSVATVTYTVTMPRAFTANTLYDVMASLRLTGTLQPLCIEATRTSTTQFTITVKTANAANFTSSTNVTATWIATGF